MRSRLRLAVAAARVPPPTARVAVLAACLTMLAACSGDGGSVAGPPAPAVTVAPAAPSATGSGSASPAPAPTRTPDLSAPETVATGLRVPWGLAFLPDGSALVAERDTGHILQVRPGAKPKLVYRVPGVSAAGEGGLLGLAVARDFTSTALVYAYFTAGSDNRIVRFKLGDGGRPQVIFDGLDKAGIHNGGRIAFGPDGMLYVGTGDAGNGTQAQDPNDSNGKILRLAPDGKPAPGNPRAGSPVWSLGHRNVQGLAWDASGKMYGIEFGQNRFDEVNVIEPGKNYGWPVVEGKAAGGKAVGGTAVEGKAKNPKYVDPIVVWTTYEASPSGAAVAGGTLYVAALRGQCLWTVPLNGGKPRAELSDRYGRLRTVAVAPDGALWLTTSNSDGRGDVRAGDDRILRFPLADGPA